MAISCKIGALPVVGLALLGCTLADFVREPYPLDSVDRTAGPAATRCHPEALLRYRGTWLKLEPPAPVAPPFALCLERLEEALSRIGVQVYGRAPDRLLHAGTYACRPVQQRRGRLSEHALGNAIDLTALHFPPLPRSAREGEGSPLVELPPRLRGAFSVSVLSDYAEAIPETPERERHRRFFAALQSELRQGQLFRGVIGPPEPSHRSHLHLDMGPWPYLNW